MQSSSLQNGTQLGQTGRTPAVAPFRAAGKTAPRRQRVVTTKASQDSVPDVAKKAVAAFAAAAVAFTPFAANAAGPDLGGLVNKAEAAKDKAAGAVKDAVAGDASGKAQGAIGDAKSAAGSLKQGGSDIATKPVAFDGRHAGLQVNVGAPSLGGVADKAKAGVDKAVGAAKSASGDASGKLQGAAGDAKSAAGSLKQGGGDIATKPVAFAGSRLQVNVVDSGEPATLLEKNKKASANTGGPKKESPGSGQQTGKGIATKPVAFGGNRLQVNVGLPDAGGLADKAKAGVDKAVGAAKSASGDVGGKVQGAKGDAKSAAGSLKQGGGDIATKPVAFAGSRLQVNIVDSGEPATLLEKNKKASANTGGPKKESPGSGQQTGKGLATKPVAFGGNRLQVNVGLPDVGGLADKAKAGVNKAGDAKGDAGNKVREAASDAKTALGGVKQGEAGKDIATKPVAFNGSRLQVNVANPNPVPGGVADKDKASSAKVGDAGPDATGDARGAAQGASGDAKTIDAARKDKQALKGDVAFASRTGLQVNVSNGVFGRGEVGTQTDQVNKAGQDIKDTAADPAQSIKNAADRTGQVAERVLSNPAGGPEKSKDAAEKLATANAAVPQALSGGAQKIKDAVTSPASFNIFASDSAERMEA
jgi:hypothetical protein